MLDYSIGLNERQEFILYYERKEGKLVIHYATNDIEKKFNTYVNEYEIIKKMEEQVLNYDSEVVKYYEDMYKKSILIRSSIIPICSISSIYATSSEQILAIPVYTALAIGSLSLLKKGSDYVINKNIQKDYEKHKLYLDNKELISKYLRCDLRPLKFYNKKLLAEAKSNIDNKVDTININTIRMMKLEEIKKLLEIVKEKDEQDKRKKYGLK